MFQSAPSIPSRCGAVRMPPGIASYLAQLGSTLVGFFGFVVLLFAAGALSGCGQAASPVAQPPPSANGESPLLEGSFEGLSVQESLLADVHLLGVPLGRLRSEYCPATEHTLPAQRSVMTPAALIRAVRRSGGHATTQLPSGDAGHSSEYHFEDGPVALDYRVSYAPGSYLWQYDRAGGKTLRGRYEVPEGAHPHDLHSALALLRKWTPKPGETAHFYAVMGRKLWRVDVTSHGNAMLRQGRGSRFAWHVEGVAKALWKASVGKRERRFDLWLSDDPTRVPLRLVADAKIGRVTLDLTDWKQAAGGCRLEAADEVDSIAAVRR